MGPQSNRVVELRIPSELGYEKIAREAVATVANRLNFGQDKIEDIKTAISEASGWAERAALKRSWPTALSATDTSTTSSTIR